VHAVIVGGGATGCLTSILLARAGHRVTLLERDRLGQHPDVQAAAAAAFRPSAPQLVQPHIIMARCRELLVHRLPDVHAALLDAGVTQAALQEQMPPSLPDKSPWPGDERLIQLLTRRSTFDWVLLRAVATEPGVDFRPGVKVTGLTARRADGHPAAHVTGVRCDAGEIGADVVVDAAGRRSPIDAWLASLGARQTAVAQAECGLAYYSRHYRRRPDAAPPGTPLRRMVATLDDCLVGIWPGDNATMQVAVAPLAADHRFRVVADPDVFSRVVRTVPDFARWLDVLDPVTGVFPMGGLHNTLRRLVIDGEPVATGLHAVGDTVCTTNPTLARGLTLAMIGAADLADTLARHPRDFAAQALAMDTLVAAHIEPFYAEQATIDAVRLSQMRHVILGETEPESQPQPGPGPSAADRVNYWQVRAAAPFDPLVFRAFWKVMGMSAAPGEVYADPEVIARTREVLGRPDAAPSPAARPSRAELLAALAPAASRW
jgi:2-polyprenyl-6-methoxyphenol hydroxylase-like FAD-dependent oxidoreductase